MIADPRFSRFADEFASQWLSLDKFQVLEAGPQAVSQAHARHAHAIEAGAGRVSRST